MAFGGLTNWFKKRLEGAVAQVNPWDNGKTYNTVLQNRPPQQAPRQQVQPQQQFYNQPPSYGGGLNGLSNLFKDVFDANTPQDQYKRLSVGAPKDYVRQQAKLNQQAQQDPLSRSGIEQFGKNLLGGVAEFAGKAPGAIVDFKGSYDKSTPGKILNYSNPLLMGQNLANLTVDKLTGKPIGTTSDRNATNLQKFGRGSQDIVENKIQQSSLGQRESDNKWIAGSGRAIGNVGGQVAATVLSGGTTIPALLSGSQTFSDQQKAAKQAGKTDDEAFGIGALQGLVESASEKIGLDKLKVPGAGNFAVKTLKRFGTEGTQEAGQQFLQNLVTNKTYNPNQGLTEGVKEAGIFGGIAGGVAGSAFDFNPKEFNQNNQQLVAGQGGFVRVPGQKTELLATHNLTSDNLKKAAEIGGIPQPSLAIVNPKVDSVENFGDITLLGNNQLVDPKIRSNKVFGSDVYSPRQPKSQILANTDESVKKIREKLEPYFKQTEEYMDVEPGSAIDDIDGRVATGMAFLDDAKIKYNKKLEGYDLGKEIRDKIYQGNNEQKFRNWVEALYKDSGAESKIFGGYTNMGRKRLLDDTLDNALKVMRKEKIRSGEGGFQTGTAGEIRSRITPQFKSIKQILDAKNKLTTSEKMKAIKDTTQDKLHSFTEKLDKYATNKDSNQFTEYDRQLDAIGSYLKGEEQWFNNKFVNVPNSVIKELDSFKSELINAPTEYFEAVPDRAVSLNEFETAVVPEGTDKDVIKILNDNGLSIRYYKPTEGEAGARQESLIELLDEDNQKRFPVKEQDINQGGYINIGKNVNQPQSDNDVTERMMLDYFKSKPAVEGNALTGQGVNTPTSLSPEAKAKLIAEARTKVETPNIFNDQRGSIPIEETPNTPTRTLEQISASQSELAQRIISAKQSGDTKAIPKLKEELDAIKTELDNAQSSLTTPLKPKGFIIKETKPRGGKVDTVRVGINPQKTALQTTTQTEPTPEALQYAQAFGITPEQAIQDLNNQQADLSGTQSALNNVQNSGSNNIVQDLQDQQDYGVKEIQEKPTNTIDDVIGKYLDTEVLTDEQLNQSNRDQGLLGKPREIRDTVRKGNVFRIANNAVAKGLEMSSRGNVIGRKLTRVAQYINKNAGQDPAMIEAAQKYAGENTYADSSLLQVGKQAYDLVPNDVSRARVHAVLDPESADGAVKYDDLTQNEKQAADMLRDLGDAINDTSYRTGFISRKKWQSNRGGRYIARLYNEIATSEDVADLLDLPDIRGLHLGMYKSRVDLNEDLKQRLIRDPIKLAVIRARQVRQNEALMQYMQTAESKGYVTNKPTAGFIKVAPGNRMANWGGRYVRQDVYENIEGFKAMGKFINSVNNVLDVYDGNPLRRMRKKLLTIYNPIIRTGNVTSNYFFAYLNGINPITFQKNKIWASRALKRNDPLVIAAQRANLVGNDIVKSDKNIFNKDKAFLTDLDRNSQSVFAKIKGTPKKIDEKLSDRYGNTDDKAKIAALKTQVDRGYSVNQAIEMTRKGFQDYSRVGHAYDMAAKSPIFGNAFIRFQGDLWMNIVKNAAIDHPLRLASLPLGVAVLGEALSNLAGEDDEDKKTREERAGTASIPFTKILNQGISKVTGGEFGGDRNISLEFQMPDVKKFLETGERKSVGAVDVARFTPLYMRQDIDGGSLADDLSRVLPVGVPDPSKLSGPEAKSEIIKRMATDPLIGPVISILGDTDWRGKSVSDPEGVRKGKAVYPDDPLSNKEKWQNRLQYGVRSYAPYPANEIGDIMAFMSGDAKTEQTKGGKDLPDNTGKSMLSREGFNTQGTRKTVGQGLARLFGIRAEKFGPDEASGKRERDQMFAFFDKQDRFKDTLDSETRTAFDNRHRSTRTRDGIKQEFENDPWWKYKSASELLQNPKLFKAEKKYAELQNKYDGKPIDPVFDLPKDQRNLVLAKKLKMPGAKDEGFNTLYDQEWYQNFRDKQDKYYSEKKAYNKSRGFKEQEVDNPYPEADKNLQKAMDAYFALPSGTGDRSAFIRNNPDTWNAITAQWDKQNAWTDKEREKLGLPKINRDDDKKYGYSNSKGGKSGKGGRGGRKSKSPNLPSFTIANYPRVNKVKISSKKAPSTTLKVPTVRIKTSKAKITIAKQAKKIKKTSSMV